MTKLTGEELREPNVTLAIPEHRYDNLPKAIYEELRLFGGYWAGRNIIVTVPGYRYRLWQQMAMAERIDTAQRHPQPRGAEGGR